MKARPRSPKATAPEPDDPALDRERISILGARANNLRDVNCAIERHKLVCVCGVSGSGKSSLLFSVLAAEGQTRHEALLANARRKEEASRARADAVTGLPFCVTVSQRVLHAQKRSTVATQTEIQRDLIFLVRHAGQIRCACGTAVGPPSADDLLAAVRRSGTKWVRVSRVMFRQGLGGATARTVSSGDTAYKQLVVGGDWLPVPPRGGLAEIEAYAVLVGEYEVAPELAQTLATAAGSGVGVLLQAAGRRTPWTLDTSLNWPCPSCGEVQRRATDSLLSFNSAPEYSGRCPLCAGLGTALEADLDKVIVDPDRPLLNGAAGLELRNGSFRHLSLREDTVRGVIRGLGAAEAVAWRRLPEKVRAAVLSGTGKREQPLDADGRKSGAKVLYHGLIPTLVRLVEKPGEAGDYARAFAAEVSCPRCRGRRYDDARVARYEYGNLSFLDWLDLPSREAQVALQAMAAAKTWRIRDEPPTLQACIQKLAALDRSGLGHLALGRGTGTLSGGELQRLKISRSLVGGLTNSCFILDEPSTGLHAADNEGMIRNLCELRDAGNTVILADHDPDFIAAADARIVLGPGAGHHGGRILTRDVPLQRPSRPLEKFPSVGTLKISDCSLHNIRGLTVSLPLGRLVCLTGVSGSGKSTFARGILVPALKATLFHGRRTGPAWAEITGVEQVRTVLAIEQAALSRSRRSLVSTYVGIADPIRALLAGTELARQRGYRPAMFSANRPEGRCPACLGLGVIMEEDAATAVAPVCDACRGSRYRDAVLDCRWQGRNIADMLAMEIGDAIPFFSGEQEITRRLELLGKLGLGHLKLGRPTPTLSGGEAQRLKLAAGIADSRESSPEGIFFVLDEPTAGLHGRDVQTLLELLDRLLAGGRNTIVIIEHDLDVIRACDHVIDFGPGSASEGGRVVAQGAPAEIATVATSKTGAALRRKSLPKPPQKRKISAREQVAGSGAVPSVDEAKRFAGFLHQHYDDEPSAAGADDGSTLERRPIRPTYRLTEPEFPPSRLTLLEALRFITVLDDLLQPLLRFEPESREIVWVSEETVGEVAAKLLVPGVRLAWSLATDLISEGKVTRSTLPILLRHAGETGARQWTDQNGLLHDLTDEDFRQSDPFCVRVLSEEVPDIQSLRRALQLGGGWACALTGITKGSWKVKAHLINRPLSLVRRKVARRTLLTGLNQKRSVNACPFCAGAGTVTTCDEALICAMPQRSLSDPEYLTPGARMLFGPVIGRLTKTLEFFAQEGIIDLLSSHGKRDNWDQWVLLFGYPWARFPIPGRAAQKDVDFYEWRGLLPLVLDRLHLSKDTRWRSKVEASFVQRTCEFCHESGLNWSVLHTTISGMPLLDFLSNTTFHSLRKMVDGILPRQHALRRCIEDACDLDLGHLLLQQPCAGLTAKERSYVRLLALRHAAFAEAGYLLPINDCSVFEPSDSTRLLVFQGGAQRVG